jgi:hypothetical protein
MATSPKTRAIERELDRISPLGAEDLRREWRKLYGTDAPKISRDLLALGVAYKFQEIQHGGLGKATRRKLRTIAKALRKTGRVGATPSLSLKPGARLVREWRGRTHTITVTEDGFEYAGTSYSSLRPPTGLLTYRPRSSSIGQPDAAPAQPAGSIGHFVPRNCTLTRSQQVIALARRMQLRHRGTTPRSSSGPHEPGLLCFSPPAQPWPVEIRTQEGDAAMHAFCGAHRPPALASWGQWVVAGAVLSNTRRLGRASIHEWANKRKSRPVRSERVAR